MGLMDIIVIVLLLIGLFFFFGGAVGILRFPDFYTRLHPAGKLDTMGSLFMLGGLALHSLGHYSLGEILVSLKIILIVVFVFLASPTATHAIVDAGIRAGLKPFLARQDERDGA
jgi:multicomponent Na+:H+ antiporter subunit G